MDKNKLLLLPFSAGLVLMFCSWYLSYPLSINSVDDFVFNHMSILHWFSLPLLLASMYMIAVTSKNHYLKWIMTVGIVMTMYSASYFYHSLSTSDSHFYRGLNEYFIGTKNLDSSQPGKWYLQWPTIFILSDIATSLSGLELAIFEFLMYTIIGFMLATTLYIYASKAYKKEGFLAVVAFFLAMFYYLNYQFAAFTIAFGLLLLLFILDTQRWTSSIRLTMLVLFTGITITHAYVPLFFVIYLLVRSIINRSKKYARFFLLTLVIFLLYQVSSANIGFANSIWQMMHKSTEITRYVKVRQVPVLIDAVAQEFSTTVLITSVVICVAGFVILLIRRKMRNSDKAIFLAGAGYFGLSIILYVLGQRAIPLAFIPISLGASYLFESRFKPYLKIFFLVLLVLFSFIPLHLTFFKDDIFFQTRESYKAENFFIDHYNWAKSSVIVANYRVMDYFVSKVIGNAKFSTGQYTIEQVDTIFYTVGLGLQMEFLQLPSDNYTIEEIIDEERLNVVYNSGFSLVATRR